MSEELLQALRLIANIITDLSYEHATKDGMIIDRKMYTDATKLDSIVDILEQAQEKIKSFNQLNKA